MRGNVITLNYVYGDFNKTEPVYQYDYGQRLILRGVELPETYEMHFGNRLNGDSKTCIGNSDGVDIPDEYLLTGESVYFWLFLHSGDTDGETELYGVIPVRKRAKPTNAPPTPVQQDVITQAIAALNDAVETVEAGVEHYPKVIDGYWYIWDEETQEWVSTGEKAQGEKGDRGERGETGATPNITIGTVTTGEPGTDASATMTGTAENPVLSFTIPRGDPGDLSSSDIATDAEMQEMINDYYGGASV